MNLHNIRIHIPRSSRGFGSKDRSPVKPWFKIFLLFLFSVQKLCNNYLLLLTFQSMNIVQYGWKTSSSCRIILMLLATEGSEWCICLLAATPRICETTKYEPELSKGWVYTCNFLDFWKTTLSGMESIRSQYSLCIFYEFQNELFKWYVYWTVHHCDSWRIRDQLDVTSYYVLFHFFYA